MNRRHLVWATAVAMLLGAWSGWADAASTPISACPFSITAGGTYGLANDLTASGDCITITQPLGASVTVNLNGFTITGDGSGVAIVAPNPGRKISVVGPGTIAQFVAAVDIEATTDVTVKRLTVTDVLLGILIEQGSITDSEINSGAAFGDVGVFAGDKTTVTNVSATGFFAGIVVGARSSITQSAAEDSLFGIIAGEKSRVKTTMAHNNVTGILVGVGGVVTESTADGNEQGIVGQVGANINKNTVSANANGIVVDCPATVQQNTLTGNTLSDINTNGEGCRVKNNTITP